VSAAAPLALALALVAAGQDLDDPALRSPASRVVRVTVDAPGIFVPGEPYPVELEVDTPPDGGALPIWAVSASAFDLDGVSLGARGGEGKIPLSPGQTLRTTFDLEKAIVACSGFQGRDFRLAYAGIPGVEPRRVTFLERAERGIDFQQLPLPQLDDYDVVLQTSHGWIWLQLWPEVAPQHVRNFLDLAYTGFYDDSEFHRVIPGFMIQGGSAKPGRPAPRRLKNEFNDRRHVPGVLSMARLPQDLPDAAGKLVPAFDSATCEFFIVHKVSPHLDGQYTAFGRVVAGLDVVERIVESVKEFYDPRDPRTHKPRVRQVIRKALVVKAPARRPGDEGK